MSGAGDDGDRPLPRWWRVENGQGGMPEVSVAYETVRRTWWEWWPETELLHPTHWLQIARDYPDSLMGEGYRFVPLAQEDVRALLTAQTGQYDSEHDHLIAARREEAADGHTLDPFVLLDTSGLSPGHVGGSRADET